MKEKLFNPYKRYNGIYIPDGVYNHPTLTPTAKLVYGRLLRYAGKEGFAYPKQKTLATQLKISLTNIKNIIKQLIDEKFIVVEKGNPLTHQPNTYYFLEHECLGSMEDTPVLRRATSCTSVKPRHVLPNKESHKEESQRKKIYKKKNNKTNLYLPLLPEVYTSNKTFIPNWKLFAEMRLVDHKKWNERCCKGIIKKLTENKLNAKGASKVLLDAVSNNWVSIFPENLDKDDPSLFLTFEERQPKMNKAGRRRRVK